MWGLPHPRGVGAHGCPLLPKVSEVGWRAAAVLTQSLFGRCLNRLGLSFPRSLDPSFYHVKVGGLTLSLLEPHSTLVAVRNIFVYPTYLWEDASSGDIALVQLDPPLQPPQLTPVCLPAAQAPLTPGTVCWVTGWGATQERGKGICPLPSPCPEEDLARACAAKLRASSWPRCPLLWIWGSPTQCPGFYLLLKQES